MSGPHELERLLSIKKTQLQMMIDRGFQISGEEDILDMTTPQFNIYLNNLRQNTKRSSRSLVSRFYVNEVGQRKSVLVYYADLPEVKNKGKKKLTCTIKRKEKTLTAAIEPYIAILKQYVPNISILIVSAPLGSQARTLLIKQLSEIETNHELHYDQDLVYNPTHHVDVPKHELVPNNQVTQLLNEMKASKMQLPLMKTSDPVAQYYGWPPGSIIRIYRNDDSVSILSPRSINYRILTQ